ncbi:MAG: hypothetical protein ABGX21_06470, partial [Candidatus Poseidoniia archaeon]
MVEDSNSYDEDEGEEKQENNPRPSPAPPGFGLPPPPPPGDFLPPPSTPIGISPPEFPDMEENEVPEAPSSIDHEAARRMLLGLDDEDSQENEGAEVQQTPDSDDVQSQADIVEPGDEVAGDDDLPPPPVDFDAPP